MKKTDNSYVKLQITENPSTREIALWHSFSIHHTDGNFFQSPSAFQLFQKTEYYSPFVVFGWRQTKLVCVLSGVHISEVGIKSLISKRTIIWGGPLVDENSKYSLDLLLSKLKTHTRSSIYVEFRNIFKIEEYRATFARHGFNYKKHLNYIVPISTPEEQKRKISKSKVRQIKSSIKNGAIIEEAKTLSEVKQFYSILKDLFQNKVKKPLPPFMFFKDFFNQSKAGKILLIKYGDTIIGGIVCPIFESKTIYEWYIAGMDGKFKGIYPSVLATWAAIEYASLNGLKYFDFLGAGSPSSDYGVRDFKSKFGGTLVEFGRLIRINKPMLYQFGKAGLRLQKLIKF